MDRRDPAGEDTRGLTVAKRVKRPARASAAVANVHRMVEHGLPHALGIRFVSVTRRKITAEMRIAEDLHISGIARVYGGAIMAFADMVGAAGAVANLPPGYRTSTIESKTNFIGAGVGPVLKAVSIPLHIGRTTTVWQTTVSNADGRAIAIVTQTQIVLPPSNA